MSSVSIRLLSLAAVLAISASFNADSIAQTSSQETQVSSPASQSDEPAQKVTRAQLEAYLQGAGTLGANEAFTEMQLTAMRKKLPDWFPQNVWQEVAQKIRAISLVDVYLPVYQKYLDSETMESLLLLYQGPTGKELARVSSQRITASLLQGNAGYSADMQAADKMHASGEDTLVAKRMSELTPAQQAACVKASNYLQTSVLRQLDDGQNAAYSNKTNQIWLAVTAAHKSEIAAAQHTASNARQQK